VIAVQAACDLIYADGFYAPINGSSDAEFFLDLVIGEQFGGLS
jgi:hypothetical protein